MNWKIGEGGKKKHKKNIKKNLICHRFDNKSTNMRNVLVDNLAKHNKKPPVSN